MVNCPSAPMFQTPALKPNDRPMAIRIRGVAFTIISEIANQSVNGSKKIMEMARTGSLPKTKNMTMPARMVSPTAYTGVR